jgi:hypothetical protein
MDVVSRCPLRAASRVSPSARGAFTLTVVCKATFRLMPGESPLHSEQEEPNEEDNYWDDDPGRSLYSPSDVIPFKPRADILLVGHAFAPGQAPARSILTRLVVGDVEKGIEAFCDRSFTLDGKLREGPKVTRVPLRYERAAGGPGTWNPVGMRPDATDAYGSVALPNMQRPGLMVASREDSIEPIGYGPLAPTWPTRQEKLGYLSTIWDFSKWSSAALPDRLDYSFFNVAPPDQQVNEIRPNERLVLENLHPEHPRLVTSLPGIRPRAVVERVGRRDEIKLTADTLWIDTALSMCTVVWRGQLALAHRQEAGTVAISMVSQAGSGRNAAAAVAATDDPAFRAAVSSDDPDGGPTTAISDEPQGLPKGRSLGETQEFPIQAAPRDPDAAPTGPIAIPHRKPVMPFSGAARAAGPATPASPSATPFTKPLPFAPPAAPAAPPSSPAASNMAPGSAEEEILSGETLKLTRRDVIQRAALPFMQKGGAATVPAPAPVLAPPPLPIPPARASAPSMPTLEARPPAPPIAIAPPAFIPPPLPSIEAPAPAAPPPISPKPAGDMPAAPAMIGPLAKPAIDSGPDGEAPEAKDAAPKTPELKIEEVTVETCGAIAASLARRKDETAKILEERSISAADWKLVEKYWTEAIRKETDRGRMVLLRAYDAAYVAQLEKERGPITVEEYASLVVASERGRAAPVLEELSMPRGAFMRIERVWLERLAEDDALAASVRKAILAARMN